MGYGKGLKRGYRRKTRAGAAKSRRKTIAVPGYTRADGTRVSGYVRRKRKA